MEIDISSIELAPVAGVTTMKRFENVRIEFARWEDGTPLTDAEISELEETQSELIHEIWYSSGPY